MYSIFGELKMLVKNAKIRLPRKKTKIYCIQLAYMWGRYFFDIDLMKDPYLCNIMKQILDFTTTIITRMQLQAIADVALW
jgi:hypothetical protein